MKQNKITMKYKINNKEIEILNSFSGDSFTQKTIDKINELVRVINKQPTLKEIAREHNSYRLKGGVLDFTDWAIHYESELNKELGTLLEPTPKERLIGKKIRGFKFEDVETCVYLNSMNKYIGQIGTVSLLTLRDNYKVNFLDGYCFYPASEIEKHILPDDYVEWSVEGLKEGDWYWTIITGDEDIYVSNVLWKNDKIDKWKKALGLVFETEQDAVDYKNKIMSK